ncbi:MAG: RNA-binding cell elongation regulator Jag/EloR [Oscillospiraceae bacterium]
MQKFLEMSGKTEEVAVELALKQLGMDRDDVSVEILERPKSGFLGIGSTLAKVRLTYEGPDETPAPAPVRKPAAAPAPHKAAAPVAPKQSTHRDAPSSVLAPRVTTPVAEDDETAAKIVDFLTGLLAHMGVTATPTVALSEDGSYEVVLEGEGLGCLIGHRGETLDAIQQLTGYSVNRGAAHRARVHVDAEHYRARREDSLEQLAQKVAAKVVKYRRDVTLEPMNAYERHVIHTALQDVPHVSTASTGVEPNRRTVVSYKAN